MVNEDYTTTEEYDIVPVIKKEPIKKTQINLATTAGSKTAAIGAGSTMNAKGKISAFFKK